MVTFKKSAKTQSAETSTTEAETLNTNTTNNSSTSNTEELNTSTKGKPGRKPTVTSTDLSSSPFLKQNVPTVANTSDDDFTSELIKQVNKDVGMRIAFDLTKEDAPTSVKRWIPTGCEQLDYIIGNMRGGGLPEGRIVEICGKSGIGKSTLTQVIARNTQAMGGLVVYIDTENATSTQNLAKLGINLKKLVFVQEVCTEDIFKTIESTILKAKQLKKDVPVTVIWDSIAASAPKAELEAEYDQQSMGLQARALRKGLRKINQMLGNEKVLLVLCNHITSKLGVVFGDPEVPTGGTGPGFFSSVRIKLTGGSPVKDGDRIVGINVTAKTFKNRLSAPFREAEFQIIFGSGIDENDQLFDRLREWCDKNTCIHKGKKIKIAGTGGWKAFTVSDAKTGEVLIEKSFNKSKFLKEVRHNSECKEYVDALMDSVFILSQEEISTLTGVDEFSGVSPTADEDGNEFHPAS